MNLLVVIASGCFGGVASVLLRLAALKEIASLEASLSPLALRGLAVVAYGAGFLLYAVALRKSTLSAAYPLMIATSILVVMIFTAVYERHFVSGQVWGAAVILVGIWLLLRA